MKYKHIIALAIAGLLFYFAGAWSKITHQAYADALINSGFVILLISGLLAIIKIVSAKNKDSFLNQ
jgi:hypothetical protein